MKRFMCVMLSFIFILFTSACSCNNTNGDEENNKIYESKNISVSMVKAYSTKDMNGAYTPVYPFNTTISLSYFKDEDIEKVEDYFQQEYVRMHQLFDRHYYYYDNNGNLINNLRVINESNGEVVTVDEDLISILKEGIRFTKLSKGKFNIAVGKLSTLWDGFISAGNINEVVNLATITRFNYVSDEYVESIEGNYIYVDGVYVDISNYDRCIYNEETKECIKDVNGTYIRIDASAPSSEQINEAKACTPSYDTIENIIVIDDENNTVKVNNLSGCNLGVSITLGALAKSYAAEKITSNEIFNNGNYLLNAGQSTIKVIGKNLSRESREWNIGITDSYLVYKGHFPKYASYLMKLNNTMSVSTSSGDENHYFYNGNYYHHIIDPISGYPNQNRFSITATVENAMYADIITTALMSMDMNQTKEFLLELKNQGIKVDVIIQDKNNDGVKVYATNNMKNRITIRYNDDSLKQYLDSLLIEELIYES